MESEFVTVAKFHYLSEVYPLEMQLKAAGIECFIRESETSSVLPFHGIALGGIRLDIRRADLSKAKSIVIKFNANKEAAVQGGIEEKAGYRYVNSYCPNCEHSGVYQKKADLKQILLSFLVIPVFFLKRNFYCGKCHHEWEE